MDNTEIYPAFPGISHYKKKWKILHKNLKPIPIRLSRQFNQFV